MPATHTPAAPTVTAAQAATLLVSPLAVVALDLETRRVSLLARAGDDVWEDPTVLVLATHADAVHAARTAAGQPNFRDALLAALNADLAELHAAGEIPTIAEIADVLAELDQYEAEVIDLAARRAAA